MKQGGNWNTLTVDINADHFLLTEVNHNQTRFRGNLLQRLNTYQSSPLVSTFWILDYNVTLSSIFMVGVIPLLLAMKHLIQDNNQWVKSVLSSTMMGFDKNVISSTC